MQILRFTILVFFISSFSVSAVAETWKSIVSNKPVTLTINNYLMKPIELYWIDYQGDLKLYGTISPGSVRTQTTFATHPWLIKYDGLTYLVYRADERPQQSLMVGLDAIGTLQRESGEVIFQPVTAYEESSFSNPTQTSPISLIIKSRLSIGPDRTKYLHIDLDGSIVSAAKEPGNLAEDNDYNRGWFVEKVTTRIRTTDGSLRLLKAADISGGGESGSVTSSTSTTFSFTGGAKAGVGGDKGPTSELSGSLGYSQTVGTSYTRTLKGFTPRSPVVEGLPGSPVTVSNDYDLTGILFQGDGGLKPYTEAKSLVNFEITDDFWGGLASVFTTRAWYGFKVHGLPSQAKKGLGLVSQAVFFADHPSFNGKQLLYADVSVTLRRTWVTGHTKIDAKWHTETKQISLSKDFVVDFSFNYPTADDVKPYMM